MLEDAPDAYRASSRPLDRAVAMAGGAVTRRGRRDEAVALLSEALDGFEGLGASQDAARIE